MSVSEKSLATIKNKHLKPISAGLIVVKHLIIWLGLSVSLALTSLAWSFVLLLITETDWNIRGRLALSFWEIIIIIMPTIWLFGIGIFFILAFYFWRATDNAYRWQIWLAGVAEIFLSLIIGWIFFQAGLPDYLDDYVTPEAHQVSTKQAIIWAHPERGVLSGRITKVSSSTDCCGFEIEDWQNNFWQVVASSTALQPRSRIIPNELVKLLGTKEAENIFIATEIRPWNNIRKTNFRSIERNNPQPRINR